MELRYYQKEAVEAAIKFIECDEHISSVIAIPTGAGKSLVIAAIIKEYMSKKNILVLSHVKEILEQNKATIEGFIPDCDVCVYSSMLGKKDIGPVTIAGIQSAYRQHNSFKIFDIIIIDECHLVSDDDNSMYRKLIGKIPDHKLIGMTATPFRLGRGLIYGEGRQFDTICYNCIHVESFAKLIKEGYLCNLTTKRTKAEMDVSDIKLIGGDFSEKDLSDRFNRDAITSEIVKEIMAAGKDRKSWLVFAIDMKHAESIAELLIRSKIPTCVIHSKMSDIGFNRDKVIKGIKSGKYRCAVSVNILTTGFDHPAIDLIAMVRPTQSVTLHVQSLGRGSRIAPGKKNCLVLDFAGNVERLGPINNVTIVEKKKGSASGDPIVKECPNCQSLVHVSVRLCPDCGYKFKFQHGLVSNGKAFVVIDEGGTAWLSVKGAKYSINDRPGSPRSIKVTYDCGDKDISEWVCIEHKGFAKCKADNWVDYRGGTECKTVYDFMEQKDKLSVPKRIKATKRGKYHLITDAQFSTRNDLELKAIK